MSLLSGIKNMRACFLPLSTKITNTMHNVQKIRSYMSKMLSNLVYVDTDHLQYNARARDKRKNMNFPIKMYQLI